MPPIILYFLGGVGLIKSKLAIELSNHFIFEGSEESPSAIHWNGDLHRLNHKVCFICTL